jgi:L-arabinose isomerase
VRNTSQIGTQALANTLLREGRWFRVVSAYQRNKRTDAELDRFFATIRAAGAMRSARLLAVGDGFPMMTDIEIDEHELSGTLGAQVTHIGREVLDARYAAIPDSQVDAHVAEMKKRYRVAEINPDELSRSARLCEAVASIVDEHHADAGTVNCHGANCLRNPNIGITACYSLGVQNAMGRPFTCTGDLPTALAMLLLKRLTGVSMYTEVQVLDGSRRASGIANSGDGEDGVRDPRAKSSIIGNANFRGGHGRGASFAYPLRPGPATLLSLTPTPKGSRAYRLIVAEGAILRDRIPDAGALAGFFRFKDVDLHTGYRRWLEAGAVHHAGTTTGHWAREIKDVGELLDMEVITVTASVNT